MACPPALAVTPPPLERAPHQVPQSWAGIPQFQDPPSTEPEAPLPRLTVSLRAVPPRPPRPPTAGVGPPGPPALPGCPRPHGPSPHHLRTLPHQKSPRRPPPAVASVPARCWLRRAPPAPQPLHLELSEAFVGPSSASPRALESPSHRPQILLGTGQLPFSSSPQRLPSPLCQQLPQACVRHRLDVRPPSPQRAAAVACSWRPSDLPTPSGPALAAGAREWPHRQWHQRFAGPAPAAPCAKRTVPLGWTSRGTWPSRTSP
mmetsp:Transcript_8164/g.18286  ORF Transcript_8164/g.18286 Transcript_8164/m.18286 type:complete len:260 (+) Transcript_8164:217-996(+)